MPTIGTAGESTEGRQAAQSPEAGKLSSFEGLLPGATGADFAQMKKLIDDEQSKRFNRYMTTFDELPLERKLQEFAKIDADELGEERYKALKAYVEPANSLPEGPSTSKSANEMAEMRIRNLRPQIP